MFASSLDRFALCSSNVESLDCSEGKHSGNDFDEFPGTTRSDCGMEVHTDDDSLSFMSDGNISNRSTEIMDSGPTRTTAMIRHAPSPNGITDATHTLAACADGRPSSSSPQVLETSATKSASAINPKVDSSDPSVRVLDSTCFRLQENCGISTRDAAADGDQKATPASYVAPYSQKIRAKDHSRQSSSSGWHDTHTMGVYDGGDVCEMIALEMEEAKRRSELVSRAIGECSPGATDETKLHAINRALDEFTPLRWQDQEVVALRHVQPVSCTANEQTGHARDMKEVIASPENALSKSGVRNVACTDSMKEGILEDMMQAPPSRCGSHLSSMKNTIVATAKHAMRGLATSQSHDVRFPLR